MLLAHQKEAETTFLLGRHIKIGEKAELALMREIEEEIGEKAIIKQFISAVEYSWVINDQGNHEVILLFEVQINDLDRASHQPHRNLILSLFGQSQQN